MNISIIVAVSENNVIGCNNKLLWHIPGDLKRFKAITMGHPIVIGRKTFESIGRPLPGRNNVVISRQGGYKPEGCTVYSSIHEAISNLAGEKEIFIIGGGEIYQQALPLANKIYLTKIHKSFYGDTFFPEFPIQEWKVVHDETIAASEKVPFSFSYITLERKTQSAANPSIFCRR